MIKGKKKLALGKGIASLLESSTTPGEEFSFNAKTLGEKIKQQEKTIENEKKDLKNDRPYMVPVSLIDINPFQPRKIFKEKDLEELSLSIKENGLIQPIALSEKEDGRFELISGERRFRATQLAGMDQVAAIVKRVTDKQKLVLAIIENVQRSDLNCVEEALAYYQLMDEFKLTQEEVAKKIGKERSTIANFLRVLKLPRLVIEMVQKEELSFGHAKVLGSVKEQEKCTRIARKIVEEKLSVRQTESLVKNLSKPVKEITKPKINDQYDSLKQTLERKTGFHFNISGKSNGSGAIQIKFNNEAEFNDIFEYLAK